MKEWNEITVMLRMTKDKALMHLERIGFQQDITYNISDHYFLPHKADRSLDTLTLLNEMVLIRQFNDAVKLTVKHKEYAPDGTILSQSNTDLPVESVSAAESFLKALGYEEVMQIQDEACIMKKDGLGFVIEDVNNGTWLMLEIEENEQYQGIGLLQEKLRESGLLYDDSDYFVKKAQLVYDRLSQ